MLAAIRRGTTLVELMVSVGFLGIGGVALLTCVNAALSKEAYARRRALVLAAAENVMDTTRAQAATAAFVPGVTTQALSVQGLESTVTLTQTITLQAGYTDLYAVDVTASWNEHPGSGLTRADSISLDTFIRSYDT